jgi:hypothetical protein
MRRVLAAPKETASGECGVGGHDGGPTDRGENVQTSASKRATQRRTTSQYISKHQTMNLIAALDPRLIFLERAAARLILFEAGLLELDEAFHGLLASLGPRKPRRKRTAA